MRPPLTFERLEVRRTPGIHARFELPDLCGGINIIYGPNASGKTTTAQAIHALLWPKPPLWPRASFAARFRLDGTEWFVDFDAGALRYQRDGVDGTGPEIAAPDTRDRYILTLHDLLSADNSAFAGIILRESAGGYDVGKAVGQLRYRAKPSPPVTERRQVEAARRAVQEARRAQESLVADEEQLKPLSEQRREASEAAERVDILQAALDFKAAEQSLDEAGRHLASFPQGLDRLAGDEAAKLDDLRTALARARARQRETEADMRMAQAARERSRLGDVPLPPGLVPTLRARCQTLQDAAGEVRRLHQELERASAEREAARWRIRETITEQQIAEIEAGGLKKLADLVRRFEDARVEEASVAALESWLGRVEAPGDLERLERGISWLNTWLRAPDNAIVTAGDPRLPRIARVAAALAIVEALLLALLVHLALALLAAAGAGLLLAARRPAPAGSTGVVARDEYVKLGLEQPNAWSPQDVEALVDRLNGRLRQDLVDHEKAQRWADLAERRKRAERERAAVETKRDQLMTRYGLARESSAELYLLAQNLDRWQDAEGRSRSVGNLLEQAGITHRQLLDEIKRDLATFGYAPAADHAAALGQIDDLDQRIRAQSDAAQTVANARRSLEVDILPTIAESERRYREIFERIGLQADDEVTLRVWLSQLESYREAKNDLGRAEGRFGVAAERLAAHPDLREASLERLRADLQETKLLAAELEPTRERIVRIETRIGEAKQKHDLEHAIAAEQAALDTLRATRDEEYRLAAGWVLGEFVRQQTRDRDRPRVFHRARELFSRITQGRYRLEFSDEPQPGFRATDTTTGMGHALDELSSATRVQLLMAVRVAFIEEMEQGPKLPLILDETLGNCDEQRARAVIEATIEICRDGRQVFYFTAQHDEVGKWVGILRGCAGVEFKTINLTEVRGLADLERLPSLEIVAPPVSTAPAPNGASHAEYREVLGVPGIDPWSDVGGVHLWYLVYDIEALHHVLSHGVMTWGQLKTLIELGGANLLDGFPGTDERAQARARVLKVAVEGWRIGRGRLVDRTVILDSGVITDAFLDDVAALAATVNGDAAELITALDTGKVRWFRRQSIDELRAHFQEHGYIDPAEPLTAEDLRVHMLAAAAEDLGAGRITREDIALLLANLPSLG